MKKTLFLLFIIINMNLNAQLELAPDNPILNNVTVLTVSEKDEVLELPPLEINFTYQSPTSNGTRVVYFVHGLGGNANSWLRAAIASENPSYNVQGFHARNIHSSIIDYSSQVGSDMGGAVNYLKNHIRNTSLNNWSGYDPDRTKNFIIAHSQGGVVVRSLLKFDTHDYPNTDGQTRGYGGFVTVASPLQGARILNNLDKNFDMAVEACTTLSRAKTPFVLKLVFHLIGRNFIDTLCSTLSYNVFPYFFKDNTAPITNDYHVGSQWITDLNNSCNNQTYINMPKVAFYGIEPRTNIFWRTLNWFKNNPNNPGYWEANDDFSFYENDIKPVIMDYNSELTKYRTKKRNLEANRRWYLLGAGGGLAYYYYQLNKYNALIDDWQAGVTFFNSVNDKWETIIGSQEKETGMVTYYQCVRYMPPNFFWQRFTTDPNNCPPYFTLSDPLKTIQAMGVTTIYKESDGVVLAESAYDLPHATHPPVPHRGIEKSDGTYTGSSHMQIRNDDALKRNLHLLYEGEYGLFFKTDVLQ